jgi:hypothetical protein
MLKTDSRKFTTSDGKTFDSISLDLKNVAKIIGVEAEKKLALANKKAIGVEAALSEAEDKLAESKAEVRLLSFYIKRYSSLMKLAFAFSKYEAQLPQWLSELGQEDNLPKWIFLALCAPFVFLRRLTVSFSSFYT